MSFKQPALAIAMKWLQPDSSEIADHRLKPVAKDAKRMSRKRRQSKRTKPRKQKRRLTAADRKRRRETMIIFVNGKQKRVPRPKPEPTEAELLPCGYDEYFIIQNDLWEYYRLPPVESSAEPMFDFCYANEGEISNNKDAMEPGSFGIQMSFDEVLDMWRADGDVPF